MSEPKTYTSDFYPVQLIALELEEPQPGRMIWRYEFYIDNQLAQHQYLNYKWSGLYPNLQKYQYNSEKGRFVLIPAEGIIIYDCKEKSFFKTPASKESINNAFVGNKFIDNLLFVFMQRSFQIINLDDYTSHEVVFQTGRLQIQDLYYQEGSIALEYKDLSDYSVKTERYDLGGMRFSKKS